MDRLLHALKQISERHGELVFTLPREAATAEPHRSTSTALVVVEPPRPTVEPESYEPTAQELAPPTIPDHLVDWVEPPRQSFLSIPAEYVPVEYLPVEFVPVEHSPADQEPFEDAAFEAAAIEEVSAVEVSLDEVPASEPNADQPPAEEVAVENVTTANAPVEEVAQEPVEPEPQVAVVDETPAPVVRGPVRSAERRYYTPLAVSEEIAAVRDHILAQMLSKPSRVIGLVHADRIGEESAVVAELARAFVGFAAGEVLAIDARSRGAGWGAKLGCKRSGGAEELLLGTKTLEQVVHPTTWAGLHAVPAGMHRQDIQSARSAEIEHQLACCRESYNTVLVDLGCVDAMHVVPVARRCDATFLIVRLGETPRQHARTALARLQYAGVNALGCILTSAPAVSSAA